MKNRTRVVRLLSNIKTSQSPNLGADMIVALIESCGDLGNSNNHVLRELVSRTFMSLDDSLLIADVMQALILVEPASHSTVTNTAAAILRDQPKGPSPSAKAFVEGCILGHMDALIWIDKTPDATSTEKGMDEQLSDDLAALLVISMYKYQGERTLLSSLTDAVRGRLQNAYGPFCANPHRAIAFCKAFARDRGEALNTLKDRTFRGSGEQEIIESVLKATCKGFSYDEQLIALESVVAERLKNTQEV